MDNQTLLKYAGSVPRYTSYPTAPNFTTGVGAETHRSWLATLARDQNLSLYFHVPFCRSLCWFCGCNTTVINDLAIAEAYAHLLEKELELVADAAPRAGPVSQIHLGGGTPTELGERALGQVMEQVAKLFEITSSAEIAIEVDPRALPPGLPNTLARLGFNRASLGIQDLDPAVQASVNRIQPLGLATEAADALRASGIEKLNVDLMIGLPQQTEAGVQRSVEAVVEVLCPDRISVFAYAHVPWMRRHQRLIDERKLPVAAERLAQTKAAERVLVEMGYVAIGLDHFARPGDQLAQSARTGTLRRNFQGYVTDQAEALIGLGASAISAMPQGYTQNAARVADYRDSLAANDFAVSRGFVLSEDDRIRRDIIQRLMCDLKVDLGEVSQRWHVSLRRFESAIAALAPIVEDGLVKLTEGRIEIDTDARSVVRSVCAAFDVYLAPNNTRHSAGI